jgi:L,D-peptidoglycan transpeptidase YkuD (ErfK/YbiS/YcfS/YnhG family)
MPADSVPLTILVDAAAGQLSWPGGCSPCALGKGGIIPAAQKREGDGATPLGRWPLLQVMARRDRVPQVETALPMRWIAPDDGWCDAPEDARYNQFVTHPYGASAEQLWREDGLYDALVVLGHNSSPVVPGLGSAIFLHCSAVDDAGQMKPTQGCVALPRETLLRLLQQAGPGSSIEISKGTSR